MGAALPGDTPSVPSPRATRGLLLSWGHTELISALIHLQVTSSLSYSADKAP